MMIRNTLILCIFCFVGDILSQDVIHINAKDIEKLKAKTLLVIQYPNAPKYNAKIKALVESSWDFCKYKFIEEKYIVDYARQKGYSFLGFCIWPSSDPTAQWGLLIDFGYYNSLNSVFKEKELITYVHAINGENASFCLNDIKGWDTEITQLPVLKIISECDSLFSEAKTDMFYHSLLHVMKSSAGNRSRQAFYDGLSKHLNIEALKGKKIVVQESTVPDFYWKNFKGWIKDSVLFQDGFLSKYYEGGVELVSAEKLAKYISDPAGDVLVLNVNWSIAMCYSLYDPKSKEIVCFGAEPVYRRLPFPYGYVPEDPEKYFLQLLISLNNRVYQIEKELPDLKHSAVLTKATSPRKY